MKGKGNDGSGNSQDRDYWVTNKELWDKLDKQYHFGFDCCANKKNTKTKLFSSYFEGVNKVKGTAWMNPPFSRATEMFEHFFDVVEEGVAIYRIDNPETKIWQDVIYPNASWVFVPKGRISYTPFDITISGGMTRFPSALIGYNIPPVTGIDGTFLLPTKLYK